MIRVIPRTSEQSSWENIEQFESISEIFLQIRKIVQWPSEEQQHLPKIPWENTWQISRTICQNRLKNIPKWCPAEGGHDVKKIFECSDPQAYTKNNCKKFCEKILNDSQQIKKNVKHWQTKMDKICPKIPSSHQSWGEWHSWKKFLVLVIIEERPNRSQ